MVNMAARKKTRSLTFALAVSFQFFSFDAFSQEQSWGASSGEDAFDAIWEKVNEKFFDPEFRGLDWVEIGEQYRAKAIETSSPAAFSYVINRMLSNLDTSHTAHYTADDIEYYLLLDVYGRNPALNDARDRLFDGGEVTLDSIGIFTMRENDQVFIQDVLEGGPAALAGLNVGDEIIDIDDRPFHPIRSLRNAAGKEVHVRIRQEENGPVRSVAVVVESISPKDMFIRAMNESAQVIEQNGKRIGYIHIWSSAAPEYRDALEQQVRGGVLKGVDALVMDMRGKIGGGGLNYLEILDPRGPQLSYSGRGFAGQSDLSYRDRTVWLIDEEVRSSAEILAYTIRRDGYGPMIGTNTAGAVVGGSASIMPDDSLLYVAVADLLVDGERLEGVGVAPDIVVEYSVPYSAGKDPQLERALKEAQSLAGQ